MSLFLAKRLSADSLLHFGTLSTPFYSKYTKKAYILQDWRKVGTQGDLTQICPTIPNPIVNLDFHVKTDPGLSRVSNTGTPSI